MWLGLTSLLVCLVWPNGLNTFFSFLITRPLLKQLRKSKPLFSISKTEKEALDAGGLGVEKEFFNGVPDFKKFLAIKPSVLSLKEEAFLTQQTPKLCRMSDEWQTVRQKTLSLNVLEKTKKEKFLGLSLPEDWGGLGFSTKAHSLVLQKISSSNMPLAAFVAVPNSLGPANLLLRYGTTKQKEKYLHALASGVEIPCFALTEPEAGSDASAISSSGLLFKAQDGQLKVKLNWNKRWISFATIATLAAVAFRLKDPNKLLGKQEDLGITLALVPLNSKGTKKGLYHNTLGVPLYNGPLAGENVILDAEEAFIGGLKCAGKGWKMIMESLSLGRSISIPAMTLGGMTRAVKVTGMYARVRKQFGQSIGKFEGVQEALARIAGKAFLSQTLRDFILAGQTDTPASPIASSIAKCSLSEWHREILKDSMDILSGSGISLGPKNKLALLHTASPLFITVEGSNTLTRSFILFGQGLLRCHPFVQTELNAFTEKDFKNLNSALFNHAYHFLSTGLRAVLLLLSRGLIVPVFSLKRGRRIAQKLAWSTSLFSFFTELFLLGSGPKFRFKESLSGRFADILSAQYILSALLWRWNLNESLSDCEIRALKWGCSYNLNKIQRSFEELICNMNVFWILKAPLYLLFRLNPLSSPTPDRLSGELAKAIITDSALFKNLTKYFCPSKDNEDSLNKLEKAWRLACQTDTARLKLKQAIKNGKIPKHTSLTEQAILAEKQGLLSDNETALIQKALAASREAIQADTFTKEEYFNSSF